MPFKKYKKTLKEMSAMAERTRYKVGDRVKTTIVHGNNIGYMTVGTEVTITAILEGHGYDIKDDAGHCIYNIGWIV